MKLSVVMPVYNSRQYICEAVDSILNQTFRDYEFIIIDDGSSDGTAQILDSYTDSRIIRFTNERNMGVIYTRIRANAVAKGEYIAMMDHDDISVPNRLERQVDFLDKNPHIGAVGTQLHFIDEHSNRKPGYRLPCNHSMIVWNSVLVQVNMVHGAVMLRREIFEKVGGYDQNLLAEDYDLWLRFSLHTQLANLPNTLVMRRNVASSITHSRKEAIKSSMQHSMGWYIADLLEKPIPKETINTFFNFYRFGCVSRLTSEQVSDLVDLTIRCYTMLFEKKIIFEEDRDAIHSDMVQKIVKILFCHENYRASRLFKVCAILSNFLNSVRRFIRK